MFKKLLAIIIAATLFLSMAGSAFAAGTFADLELIRVYYDRAGVEIATDLGSVTTLINSTTPASTPTNSIPGSFGSLTTGYAVYFAFDRNSNQFWASGITSAPSVINGTSGGLTTLKSGSTNVYSLFNTAPDKTYTGLASAINSYKNKLSATQGTFANAINSATKVNTEASLTALIAANTDSVIQILYYWSDGLTTDTVKKTGVAVATITTHADGSTTISPPPAAATAPGAPTIGTATATGDGTAQVAFAAPTSDGGSAITLYTATSNPGGITGTGTANPITVNGLTNGTLYKFTVTAKNAVGTSAASTESNSVTTTAGVTPPTTKTTQTIGSISFTPATLAPASTTTASAVATSALTVVFTSKTPSVCTVSGDVVHGVTAGTCTIAADQSGNDTFSAALQVTQSITVAADTSGLTGQTIVFGAAPTVTVGGTGTVSATGGASGNAVTFTAAPASVCTSNGAIITGVAAGACTVTANQAGNTTYSAAALATQAITVVKKSQTITFTPPSTATYGDVPVALIATASSDLTPGFTLVSGPATLTGSSLTITGVGSIVVKATQAGTTSYSVATDVQRTITVAAKALTVTADYASRAFGADNPAAPGFTAPALVGSDTIASVTYSYATTATSTAALGSTHSITLSAAVFGSGSAANYIITYIAGTLTIAGSTGQTVTFSPPASATYGDAAIALSATASSNLLPVRFTLVSGPATLSGSTLTITGAGSIAVKATQAGNETYAAAPDMLKTIQVAAKALTITAANASRVYAAANPAAPGFTAPALVGSDTIATVTYSYAATATSTAAIGSTHAITPGAALFSSGSAANYSILYTAGTLTVAGKGDQIISFAAAPKVVVNGTGTVSATFGASVNAVVFTSSPATVCTNDGATITGVTAGACTVTANQAGDTNYNAAPPVTLTVTVSAISPGVPTGVTATAGNAEASVSFTAPTFTGGSAITGYTVTSSPGGLIGTGLSSPIIVKGLTNYKAYTFTVTAKNVAGTGAASAASNVATPEYPPITFTVFPTSGDHGKIAPAANQTVVASATASFVITPDSGYQIATVTGCDGTLNRSTSVYSTAGILNNCTVEATFIKTPTGYLQDALKALRFAIGLDIPTAADIASGDVAPLTGCLSNTAGLVTCTRSPDGKIDIADVVAIMQRSLGMLSW